MTEVLNIRHLKNKPYVYIGRGAGACHMNNTPVGVKGWLGNPYVIHEREINIAMFKADFLKRIAEDEVFREHVLKLRGETLGCFCRPQRCHGDVIAEFLDAQEK